MWKNTQCMVQLYYIIVIIVSTHIIKITHFEKFRQSAIIGTKLTHFENFPKCDLKVPQHVIETLNAL